jgi:CubicO group peptidase (beta-lactamase class C family)
MKFLTRIPSGDAIRVAAFVCALLPLSPATAQNNSISDSALSSIVGARIAARKANGIIVAVLEKGRAPRIVSAGVSGISGLPLNANTLFEIGSVTKAFTGSLLADMVARGEVRLDDPISKYLPKSVHVPARKGKEITLVDLATQTSGLPRLPTNMRPADFSNPYADYTVQQLYDFLSAYTLPRDIGEKYEYSNVGVGLLGHVLSLRAGKPYEQLLRERILEPLKMNDTMIQLADNAKPRMAQGFNALGAPVRLWDLPALEGMGALRSTTNDLLKFLAANLDTTATPIGRVLADARVPRHDAGRPDNSIGLAWHVVNAFGTIITWHNGGTGGFHSFIGMDAARQRGVIVLSNSVISLDDIGFHILEPKVALVAN